MKPRKKRIWSASDFAQHAFSDPTPAGRRRALRFLKRLDGRHGGRLLIPAAGTREFTFYPATLARLEPDLFTPIESLEFRLDAVEEALDETRSEQRDVVSQVRQNSRDIAALRQARTRAA